MHPDQSQLRPEEPRGLRDVIIEGRYRYLQLHFGLCHAAPGLVSFVATLPITVGVDLGLSCSKNLTVPAARHMMRQIPARTTANSAVSSFLNMSIPQFGAVLRTHAGRATPKARAPADDGPAVVRGSE